MSTSTIRVPACIIRFSLCLSLTMLMGCGDLASSSDYQEYQSAPVAEAEPQRITRLIWQDRSNGSMRWGDLTRRGETWTLSSEPVDGFPEIDVDKQDLVQMKAHHEILIVGIRDQANGEYQSGWVAVDVGTREESHGDHTDWKYSSVPRTLYQEVDKSQGNPAHLYLYDDLFYLANDRKNGFSQIDPKAIVAGDFERAAQFFSGGGGHITLAAVENRVAYSTWIDGSGPHAGRIDVVNLHSEDADELIYSLNTPTGGLHGATANSGRLFFAPKEGICWVDVDLNLNRPPEEVKVHHIPLGQDEETSEPLRTGAFVNHRNWVLFTTGRADSSALCLLDAQQQKPEVIKLPIDVSDGLGLTTPSVFRTQAGKRYACLFQDKKSGELVEQLTIVDLDPNRDRDFRDAIVAKTIPVGPSLVVGHHGHHDIGFVPDSDLACISNPGDGSLWILSLTDLEIIEQLQVGGIPTSLIATAGKESDH